MVAARRGGLPAAASALLWKVHHALADGSEAMRLAGALLWDDGATRRPHRVAARARRPGRPVWSPPPCATARGEAGGRRRRAGPRPRVAERVARAAGEARRLPGAVTRDLIPSRGPSPLDSAVGRRRDVAFASVSLDGLKRVEHAQPDRTTVNDVLLALVTGALRRWISHHGGEPHEINAKIPVSLHDRHAHPDALANRDSFLCVGLPLSEPDPLVRVRPSPPRPAGASASTTPRRSTPLFRDLRHLPRPVSRLATRLTAGPRVFALNVSNVPGPGRARAASRLPDRGPVVAGGDRRASRAAHLGGLAGRPSPPRADRGRGRRHRRGGDRRRPGGRGG